MDKAHDDTLQYFTAEKCDDLIVTRPAEKVKKKGLDRTAAHRYNTTKPIEKVC
jgi:hypothetical protein